MSNILCKMDNFKYVALTVTILSVIDLGVSQTRVSKIVLGLNERLEQFDLCDIRITAELGSTDFESFQVPVTLIDVELRKNYYFFRNFLDWNVSITGFPRHKLRFPSRHRKEICMVDLILLLGDTDESGAWYIANTPSLLVAENYLLLIRNRIPMIKDIYSLVNSIVYLDHRIFIWTVIQELRKTEIELIFSFRNVLFLCHQSQGEFYSNAHTESGFYKLNLEENSLR